MTRITALIENAGQVLTCAPDAPDLVGALKNTVVAISDNTIAAIGSPEEIAAVHDLSGAERIDAKGGLVMPGFVDCHTHLVFHKSRVEEYAQKVQGRTAAEIRAMGIPVGITATAQMMREARAFIDAPLAVNQVEFHPLLDQGALTLREAQQQGVSVADVQDDQRLVRLGELADPLLGVGPGHVLPATQARFRLGALDGGLVDDGEGGGHDVVLLMR